MRVLVTGGTGFTGGHLCLRLVKDGCQVRTIARRPEKAAHLTQAGVEVISGDILDLGTALSATKNTQKVYHLAALYRQERVSRRAFWDVNVIGTENVLKASLANGVGRFIHCSTVGVHGDVKHVPACEDTPYGPGDHYQESKMDGEKIALRYMEEGNIALTVFRPAGIYGPGDLRFLKLFRALQKGTFWMIGSGNVFYHLTYIDDLIEGILLCGTKREAVGRTYILAGQEYVTLNTLVTLISEALGVRPPRWRVPFWPVYALSYACELICKPIGIEPPLYRRRVDFFRKNRAFDIAKAVRELDFRPKVTLQTGIRQTATWYKQNGYL